MQHPDSRDGSIYKLLKVLNVVLLVTVILHLGLCLHAFTGESPSIRERPVSGFLYLLSVFFLVVFFIANSLLQFVFASRTHTRNQRINAMIYMFSGVRHSLNNDMQVLRGNAELAERAARQGECNGRRIRQIVEAADDAIDRIEQLGAFSGSETVKRREADLNAALRQTMAKLTAELSPAVVLRLDLAHLNVRVMVDRFLLELSLSHLIRSAARLLPDGCEIVSRTHHARAGKLRAATGLKMRVILDITLRARQAVPDNLSEQSRGAADFHCLQSELHTTKALLETSGALVTRLHASKKHMQLQLTFRCSQKDPQTVWPLSDYPPQATPIRMPAANTREPPSTT